MACCSPLPAPWAVALAASAVAMAEQALLNPLTVARSRAFAGRKRPLRLLVAGWRQWTCGLRLLATTQMLRHAISFGGHAWLSASGVGPLVAGLLVGAADGGAFTPARRLSLAQHLGSRRSAWQLVRLVLATEGWAGLWRGWQLNLVRTALGGAAYFGTLAAMRDLLPHCSPALAGAAATICATVAVNPLEVALARLYTGRRRRPRGRVLWRGLGASLWRSVPSKAVSYWAIHGLSRVLAAQLGR